VFNRRVVEAIAEAVADAAVETGVARRSRDVEQEALPG
jgi:malic enzyme